MWAAAPRRVARKSRQPAPDSAMTIRPVSLSNWSAVPSRSPVCRMPVWSFVTIPRTARPKPRAQSRRRMRIHATIPDRIAPWRCSLIRGLQYMREQSELTSRSCDKQPKVAMVHSSRSIAEPLVGVQRAVTGSYHSPCPRMREAVTSPGRPMPDSALDPLGVEVQIDPRDAALLERRDAAADRVGHLLRRAHRADAERALRLGEPGDVRLRIGHALADPAVLRIAAAPLRHR